MEAQRPDTAALARETRIEAEEVRIVVSDHWRPVAKLEGLSVKRLREEGGGEEIVVRGSATFSLKGLKVEAREIRVRWLADHQDFVLYAKRVQLFQQKRERPYYSRDLSAVTMANDQVNFFQQ